METPVLFLVFNRVEHTQAAFRAIRDARPARLYVAADGPREPVAGEAERCREVRRMATAVDWPCEVKTLFRERNLGCKKAVAGALDWFFAAESEGIILEDDLVAGPDFFAFCEELLARYRDDARVAMIAGTNFAPAASCGGAYQFSRLVQIWGWATWRRAWALYDRDMATWPAFHQGGGFSARAIPAYIERYVTPSFAAAAANRVDTWDFQWSYTVLAHGLLVAVPAENLVSNQGFGEGATHTVDPTGRFARLPVGRLRRPLTPPPQVAPCDAYDRAKTAPAPWLRRLARRIRDAVA